MIREEFHHRRGRLRDHWRNLKAQRFASAECVYRVEQPTQRDSFAAKNVTMAALPVVHGSHKTNRDIAHVNEVQHEIEVYLNAVVEKMPQHQGRRREISVMRSN